MAEQGLTRTLSSKFALAVTIGTIIGLGILRGPGIIADVVTNSTLYLSLWLIGGLFVLMSTAVCAELVGMTPRSGGVYPLIRRAFGPYPGFVIGWVDWLSFTSNLAVKAIVTVEFIALLVPAAAAWRTPIAILTTTAFAAFQLRGIALSALIQQLATAATGFVVVVLALLLFFVDAPLIEPARFWPLGPGPGDWSLVVATIVFTFDGWLSASYYSGEIKGGAGAVARACIRSVVIIVGLYLLLNAALVHSVALAELAGSELALARALELAISPTASAIVIGAAILILLSHQNLGYMGGSRVLHALAVDGFAVRKARHVGKGGNPIFAVVITWAISVCLILLGGFEFLLLLSVFLFVPLYLALVLGVMILRRTEPGADRPYRAWGHPYTTVLGLAGWTLITAFQAYAERETAVYALVMIAVSWPVYRYLVRRSSTG